MPNDSLNQTSRGSTLECLNDALDHLMILPAHSLENIQGGTDAYFVYRRMVSLHRSLQAEGWYCFNRVPRYSPAYDTVLNRYTVPNAIRCRTARRFQADPWWPETRLEFPLTGDPYLIRMDRTTDSGTAVFPENERNILLDVVFAKSIDEAPEQYRTLLAAVTAEEMAPKFGVPIQNGMSSFYRRNLEILEASAEPPGNVLEDESDTLHTWLRP